MSTDGSIFSCLMVAIKEPIVTDWLMVIITIIYVIATIVISKANKDALKSSEKLVDTSIAQVNTLKEQIKITTNLQLLDQRLNLIESFEKSDAFVATNHKLKILFPKEVADLEQEIIRLMRSRQAVLLDYYIISTHVGLKEFSRRLSEVNSVDATENDIRSYINVIIEAADRVKADEKPYLEESRKSKLEEDAITSTKAIIQKKKEFLDLARQVVKDSLS